LFPADGAGSLLGRIKPLYCWLRAVFADGGYNRVPAILACFLLGLALLIVSCPRGTKGFVLLPRRWVAERTLGWIGRLRGLSRDYEHLPEVSEAMATLAMIRLMPTAPSTQTASDCPHHDFQNGLLAGTSGIL